MKVRIVKDLQLIITPESYLESIALQVWTEKGNSVLIEAYTEQNTREATETLSHCNCHLPQVHGHEEKCPEYRHHCGHRAENLYRDSEGVLRCGLCQVRR